MKRFSIFSIAVSLFTLLSFPSGGFSQDLTKGLVAHWSFCGCSVTDLTGNGHDGVLSGNPACVPGKYDQAYEFDGSNSINVPFSPAFDIPEDSALTLAAWVKPDRGGGYQALVVKGSDVWDYGLYMDVSGSFMFGCQWPNHETFSKTIPQPGVWYHVVGVYRNTDWKLYVNGKLEDELPNGTTIGRSQYPIGMAIKGNFFKDMYAGTLDEVRLYNRALSDSEVMALYLWRPSGLLSISNTGLHLYQLECTTPADTAVQFFSSGCGTVTIDSAWLSGPSSFQLHSTSFPKEITSEDSIIVEYTSTLNVNASDTAILHIRYNPGMGERDTAITIIGTASPLVTSPQRLHREAASAYMGQLDSLPLGVDINAAINLDSLWPSITDIQATYAFDSSIVAFVSYLPPNGWALSSLANHGNTVDVGIQNISSSATRPLDLGMMLFRPRSPQLATSWVTLPRFVIDEGGQSLSLCVTDNEDSHWAVKTLGAESGVALTPAPLAEGEGIFVYPNPAENEFFVRNTNAHPALITVYDAIGRTVATASVGAASTSTIDIASLARGSYVVVCQIGDRVLVRRLDKDQ